LDRLSAWDLTADVERAPAQEPAPVPEAPPSAETSSLPDRPSVTPSMRRTDYLSLIHI